MNVQTTRELDVFPLDEVAARLERGEYVRYKLPMGGRLHIDRQLPFLALYRRPDHADAGTQRLLLGQAAYLLAPGEAQYHEWLARLLEQVLLIQRKQFGASLLVELWSRDSETHVATRAPRFRLQVPSRHVPDLLLERLETALLDIELGGHAAHVALDYVDEVAPPGVSPVRMTHEDVWHLGLEVEAVYRDPASGTLYPPELNRLRQQLTVALKRAFYTFARRYTRQRPTHYHELGRQAMTPVVQQVDQQLAAVNEQFDLLLHVTPVNASEAWHEFQQNKFARAPQFNYRPRPVDPDRLKRQLYAIPIERVEDPTLALLFGNKRNELDRQINLIADRNTPAFVFASQQVYGAVEPWLLELAEVLLERVDAGKTADLASGYLGPEAIAARAREQIEAYRRQDPDLAAQVQLREDVTGVMVSRGNFLIGQDARVAAERLEATLAHEIGTHVLTYHNGCAQPFHQLQAGMAGYEPLQEGLAVLAEYLVGGLQSSRLRMLAGRVLAVRDMLQGRDFSETFHGLVHEHGFGPLPAFNITLRVYRGGGFSKDAIYLRGLVELLRFLAAGGKLELLYLGKLSLDNLALIEELQWRRVLHPARLRPLYLDVPGAGERLERLRRGMDLLELLEDTL